MENPRCDAAPAEQPAHGAVLLGGRARVARAACRRRACCPNAGLSGGVSALRRASRTGSFSHALRSRARARLDARAPRAPTADAWATAQEWLARQARAAFQPQRSVRSFDKLGQGDLMRSVPGL